MCAGADRVILVGAGRSPPSRSKADSREDFIVYRSRSRPIRTRAAAAVLAAGALPLAGVLGAGPASAAASASAPGRHALAETRPGWATGSADAGAVAAGASQSARVYLAGADPAGMAAYAASV